VCPRRVLERTDFSTAFQKGRASSRPTVRLNV
jgi:hypothetical protein